MADAPIFQLIYCSRNIVYAQHSESLKAYRDIFETSRANNVLLNITGCLLFDNTFFIQILEGGRQETYSTFKRVERDQRHSRITLLHFAQQDRRLFPNWAMAGSLRTPQQDEIYSRYGAAGLPDPTNVTAQAVRGLHRKSSHTRTVTAETLGRPWLGYRRNRDPGAGPREPGMRPTSSQPIMASHPASRSDDNSLLLINFNHWLWIGAGF